MWLDFPKAWLGVGRAGASCTEVAVFREGYDRRNERYNAEQPREGSSQVP